MFDGSAGDSAHNQISGRGIIGDGAPVPTVIGSRSKPEAVLDALGKPAAVLVITGEQDGYMEPCGCSEDQEGGLIRRYDLVERLHQRNWPTASSISVA